MSPVGRALGADLGELPGVDPVPLRVGGELRQRGCRRGALGPFGQTGDQLRGGGLPAGHQRGHRVGVGCRGGGCGGCGQGQAQRGGDGEAERFGGAGRVRH
ncbi:hypothetical protein ACFQ0T_00585 [Kitasatospora gansuensis]